MISHFIDRGTMAQKDCVINSRPWNRVVFETRQSVSDLFQGDKCSGKKLRQTQKEEKDMKNDR